MKNNIKPGFIYKDYHQSIKKKPLNNEFIKKVKRKEQRNKKAGD